MPGRTHAFGITGLFAVALIVIAVIALRPFTSPYAPDDVPGWLVSAIDFPIRTAVSAFALTFGFICLAVFSLGFAFLDRTTPALLASAFITFGSILNATATGAPLIALNTDSPTGHALLRTTLLLNSIFNVCLGVGLIGAFFTQRSHWRFLALTAGILSLPLLFQWLSPAVSNFQFISGPCWLAWVLVTSLEFLKVD
jgi:hypothetical protein